MIRTIVSLDDNKRWLDNKADQEVIPMAELIRRAVKRWGLEENQTREFNRLLPNFAMRLYE